jgi:hypothetical protein
VLLYGYFGVGKDTLAAKFPGDRLVLFLDGRGGNEFPYFEGAKSISDILTYELGKDCYGEPILVEYQDVTAEDDTLTRIEYHSSLAANNPTVSDVLELRLGMFNSEQENWETLIVSSLSAANLEAMYMEQFIKNPTTKESRQWRGGAADFLERIIFGQRSFRNANVVYIAHTALKDNGETGEVLRTVALPGRLATQAGNFFGEVWRLYVKTNHETGQRERWLQTDGDGRYQAKTHLNPPCPCLPKLDEVWRNWEAKMAKFEKLKGK